MGRLVLQGISVTRVSVITVVKDDREAFLATARSVLGQTYKNFEWIVVDGKSSDGTAEDVKALAQDIAHFISEPDTGVFEAMNKGVALASGDWVLFLNADDIFYDSETLRTYMQGVQPSDDIVYADAMRREDLKIQAYPNASQYVQGMVFDHQTALVRRSILAELKFDTSLRISGDLDLFSRARIGGYSFRKLPWLISCIKPFNKGISATYQARQQERIRTLRKYFDSPELQRQLTAEFVRLEKYDHISAEEHKALRALVEAPL